MFFTYGDNAMEPNNVDKFSNEAKQKNFSLLKEFRVFALKGNVIDLAVAVVIGAAFGKVSTHWLKTSSCLR